MAMCTLSQFRGQAMQALLLLLAFSVSLLEASVLVGSLDVGNPVLNRAALEVPSVREYLPRIISRYDIIALQDVADRSTAKALLSLVNSRNGNDSNSQYGLAISGLSTPTQLVFLFRKSSVVVVNFLNYPNDNRTYDVPPFTVHVQPVRGDSVGVRDILFTTVRTSSDPVRNLAMLQELTTVVAQARSHYSQLGTPVPDVMVLGNLNADCSSFPSENWQKISLWTDRSRRYKWLLTRSADTTVSRATSCAYDRIVACGSALRSSVVASSAAVFRFDVALALTNSEAISIGNHYPIEVVIRSADTLHQQPIKTGGPALVVHTAPIGVTSSRSAKIWFELDPLPPLLNPKKDVLTFLCRYDSAPMAAACTSPWNMTMMEEGPHTLVIIPVTSTGLNYSAASYTWTVDTKPPSVTAASMALDSDNRPIVSFTCDEGSCLYECAITGADQSLVGAFSPCWGGYQGSALDSGTVNLTVRAVDRAGNIGQPRQFVLHSTAESQNKTSDFLTENLIFVACGCTALGVSMVWVVILLMCRTSSSDEDSNNSHGDDVNNGDVEKRTSPKRDSPFRAQDGGGGVYDGTSRPRSPNNQLEMQAISAPRIASPSLDVDMHVGGNDGTTPGTPASLMAELQSTASPGRTASTMGYATRIPPAEQTTHFMHARHTHSNSRESGDGQSVQGERFGMGSEKQSQASLAYSVKQRLNCPSRSHRSSRCVCPDKNEQIHQHNERKRERRRRRQYNRFHQLGLHDGGGGGGALTDAEQYTYKPVPEKCLTPQPYTPLRATTEHSSMTPSAGNLLAGSSSSRDRSKVFGSMTMAASSADAGGAENAPSTEIKPKILDAMQRRKLAKRMMQERRAWAHYFTELNTSDGESVCSSMRSAPVLPSGLKLLSASIDEKRETPTNLSGVITCV